MNGDPASNKTKIDNLKRTLVRNHFTSTICVSDNASKFTKVLYNLTLAELYEHALQHEKRSFIMSTDALATLSGAKIGRCLRDKCVVKDEFTEQELWWRNGSPNIEIDEQSQQTFMVNKETVVEYLNSLEWVGFLNVIVKQFMNGSALAG